MFALGMLLWMGQAMASPSSETLESWMDSVVLLTTGSSLCAGVMLDEPGLVATAYHCVALGRKSKVETRSGESRLGKVVASSPKQDLALVQIEPFSVWRGRGIAVEEPGLGAPVWAMGHPFGFSPDMSPALQGLLRWSVSTGVVSSVGNILVQIDAPLNPGNSGGPVFDSDGRILGIASRKLKGEGLSFISPGSALRDLVESRQRYRWVGGQYGLVLGATLPSDLYWVPTICAGSRVSIRDRLLVSLVMGLPLGARWESVTHGAVSWVSWEGSAQARIRLGRGRWSTTLEGGGILVGTQGRMAIIDEQQIKEQWIWPAIRPGFAVGGSVGGSALGLRILPGEDWQTYLMVESSFGGVLGTF